MSKTKKPIPKSQKNIFRDTLTPYAEQGLPSKEDLTKRALQRSRSNDDVKDFRVGLIDIDEAIMYYFKEVIKPKVTQNNKEVVVPILYGAPEKWKAVQKDGFYRDKNGKIQTPLIMFKRESVEKNRGLGNKLDANNVKNFGIFKRRYSQKNQYDRFDILNNRVPVEEFYGVIIPDYVNITYSCTIITDYMIQMNKLIEGINFASDSYWGDPKRFRFRAMIDNFTPTVEVSQGEDRIVKTEFQINLLGHIITDTINTSKVQPGKFYSKAAVNFKLETSGTIEELTSRAGTPERESQTRFFDTTSGRGIPGSTVGSESRLGKDIGTNFEVGGSNQNTVIPKGTTFTEYVELVHTGSFEPIIQEPTFSLTNTSQEIVLAGSVQTFDLVFNFNRGQILGQTQGDFWNPGAVQGPRAGEAVQYIIDLSTQQSNIKTKQDFTVMAGINMFTGQVTYQTGQQPLNSANEPVGDPLQGGTSPMQVTVFEGVYPIYATVDSIEELTELPLVSMLTGNNIEIPLTPEINGKHVVDIPKDWNDNRTLQEILYQNPITATFDTTNQISSWDTSQVFKTIQGNTVEYVRYQHTGVDRGETLIKLIF